MARRLPISRKRPAGGPPAAVEIALLIKRDLGIEIEPKKIADFIIGRFWTLSTLAHELHEPHRQPGHPQ